MTAAMTTTAAIREKARKRYIRGDSPQTIADALGCTPQAVRNWAMAGRWVVPAEVRRRRPWKAQDRPKRKRETLDSPHGPLHNVPRRCETCDKRTVEDPCEHCGFPS